MWLMKIKARSLKLLDVAQGIMELHSKGILVLNLKPLNILHDEHDVAVVREFNIPILLLRIPLSSFDCH